MCRVIYKKIALPNGEEIGYREREGGKDAIIFVHGNLVSSKYWEKFMQRFPENFKLYAVDLRGAGISSYNKPIETMRDFSEDIWLFSQEMNIKKFILVGWSMGGVISMQLAADHPDAVKKLILVSSPSCKGIPFTKKDEEGKVIPGEYWKTKEEVFNDKVQVLPIVYALRSGNREIMKNIWDSAVFNYKKPEENYYKELIEDIFTVRNYPDCAWATQIFNISHFHNGVVMGTGEVDKLTMPVLLLWGEYDVIVKKEYSEETAKEIGENAHVVVIENAAHSVFIDNEEQTLKVMLDFIEK
ncbi:alpha/beta hydrolase fold protein [Thermoanaerobacter ethanolicus JW 200]|uniref:Esterase n=2 Tax=Caldanaerobacter subterraneus TaxID=911092 RepID=B7R988_9THEO|nr:alpha/beta hydrolase [Caldanaerobacter subterraneus]EGD52810.1 alpha/beta hydrolase fold protein [Thermoanaerobacter ethanolicus JW 200]KKC30393.1 Esterase [Caldanaerobacter subterraneus subsp. pacificus DSM 12653]